MSLPVYPFDSERCIGTIVEVSPESAKINLPRAATPGGQWHHGARIGTGEVGDFVVVDAGDSAVFGRIINVRLPERERLSVEPAGRGRDAPAHPIGMAHLLSSISLVDGRIAGGITTYPRIGSSVFAAHPILVRWLAESGQKSQVPEARVLRIASLAADLDTPVRILPERLFGRHCAVLGSTGGGKSWTLARLVEETASMGGKLILLDATGEFHTLRTGVRHVFIGQTPDLAPGAAEVVVPYNQLQENDLFALLKPSGQTQAPKLRAAMKSLKLIRLDPRLNSSGVLIKANEAKAPFEEAYRQHVKALESPQAKFDIRALARQIDEECVFPSGRQDSSVWGGYAENEKSYCVSLITRIEDVITSDSLACVFQPSGKPSLRKEIEEFLQSGEHRILRVSLKHLPFDHNAREIVTNAIGRALLSKARLGSFRRSPLIVILDEAHQFLNRNIGDDQNKYPLDSFDLIAKEGRKFCLNICIATQRPRDIPEGVLSQMGTLVVHRLINDKDREVVERASGDIDRSAATFLPTLRPGEAIIIGVDFPIPLTIQVVPPACPPDSTGPDYQADWGALTDSGESLNDEP